MLGALVAAIAGLSIRRLWPGGVAFLLVWPAIAIASMLPIVAHNRAELGEKLDLSATSLGQSYLQTAVVAAVIFFVFFGGRKVWGRFNAPKSGVDA
jgi:hypothetical protein